MSQPEGDPVLEIVETLVPLHCADCAVPFAITAVQFDRRAHDGRSLYCPNGHEFTLSDTEPEPEPPQESGHAMRERVIHTFTDTPPTPQDAATAGGPYQ